jgi:hypothetical protein
MTTRNKLTASDASRTGRHPYRVLAEQSPRHSSDSRSTRNRETLMPHHPCRLAVTIADLVFTAACSDGPCPVATHRDGVRR